MNFGASGEWRAIVLEAGEVVQDTGYKRNLLTNGFFADMSAAKNPLSDSKEHQVCQVGTGTTTPAETDTALGTKVAEKEGIDKLFEFNALWDTEKKNVRWDQEREWKFEVGAITANISELGFSFGRTKDAFKLHSRIQVVDDSGTATTFNLDANKQLIVLHRLRIEFAGLMESSFTTDSKDYKLLMAFEDIADSISGLSTFQASKFFNGAFEHYKAGNYYDSRKRLESYGSVYVTEIEKTDARFGITNWTDVPDSDIKVTVTPVPSTPLVTKIALTMEAGAPRGGNGTLGVFSLKKGKENNLGMFDVDFFGQFVPPFPRDKNQVTINFELIWSRR